MINFIQKKNLKNLIGLIIINIYMMYIYNLIFVSIGQGNDKKFLKLKNILANFFEILNYIVMSFISFKLFRKVSLFIITVISLLTSFLLFFWTEKISVLIIVFVFLKYLNCFFQSLLFVYQNELFETKIRNLGIGISVFFGRFLSALTPFLFAIDNFNNALLTSFYVNLVLIPFLFLMKETKNQNIQD